MISRRLDATGALDQQFPVRQRLFFDVPLEDTAHCAKRHAVEYLVRRTVLQRLYHCSSFRQISWWPYFGDRPQDAGEEISRDCTSVT